MKSELGTYLVLQCNKNRKNYNTAWNINNVN